MAVGIKPNIHSVDEDWADLIAAKSMKSGDTNFGCSMLDQKNDRFAELSLTQKESTDPHSSGMFRAIHIH
ncbi:hypothetical protein, partial [Staphylococcus pasteuri_A]